MNITIIGYGNVGSTLATAWASAGHEITVGARHREDSRARELAARYHRTLRATQIHPCSVYISRAALH